MTDVKSTEIAVQEKTEITEQNVKSAPLDYMSGDSLNKAYKNAMILAKSDLVPEMYKNRPDNVLLAMDMASRTGFSLMQVMQNLFIVRGRPGWSGSFCMSAIKACGYYSGVKYVFVGDPGTNEYGCYVTATDLRTGERVNGTLVNWNIVKAYGWEKKPGSQWNINPELMFRYRAAAFFARTECPEVLQGLQTSDELRDTYGYEEQNKPKRKFTFADVDEVD